MNASITTKYLGPTNTQIVKCGRIKASCEAGSIIVVYDDTMSSSENHYAACLALLNKLNWKGNYSGSKSSKGYIYACNK